MTTDERRLGLLDRRSKTYMRALTSDIPKRWKGAIAFSLLLGSACVLLSAILFTRVSEDNVRACKRANDSRKAINIVASKHPKDGIPHLRIVDCTDIVKLH